MTSFLFSILESALQYMNLYQRFFKYIYHNSKYINDSTQNIDLPTKIDNSNNPY